MVNHTAAFPPWLSRGDNAWQLTAATLVGLQSVPGLVILYAGIVKRKWAINSAFMAFYGFAAVMFVWVLWAYNMSFGHQLTPFVGKPGPVISITDELQRANVWAADISPHFPTATLVVFQFEFAAITVVIIAGSFLARMNLAAWMIFVPLWVTFSYTVGAFSLWGGGWLSQWGVIDYAGGYVIHVSSGTAGFVGAALIGPRHPRDRINFKPNNVLLMLVGSGILWLGWNGFNGGGPYNAGASAGSAVINTNICTATSLLVWNTWDIIFFKKPSMIGAVQGMMTGLVVITPAAGVIPGWAAIILGLLSGTIPWITMNVLHKRIPYMRDIDDPLGVFHTHTVAGLIGGISVGLFADKHGTAAFDLTSPGGAINGNWYQLHLQIIAGLFICALNILTTSSILLLIRLVIPLRMPDEMLLVGDDAVHGEDAYAFNEPIKEIIQIQGQLPISAQDASISQNPVVIPLHSISSQTTKNFDDKTSHMGDIFKTL